jgi:ribosome-associated protein
MTDTASTTPPADDIPVDRTMPRVLPGGLGDYDPRLRIIADALLGKKGLGIVVMGLRAVTDVADFFVLCTGASDQHVRSLAQEVVDRLRESGDRPWHVEGMQQGRWVLVDSVDIVVHVFSIDAREHYALERLWGDAELLAIVDDDELATP